VHRPSNRARVSGGRSFTAAGPLPGGSSRDMQPQGSESRPRVYLEDLLTVEEVAAKLKLKPSTIRAYAERGSLPCVHLGNRLRFKPSDLDLWIARRHQGERRTA
jgi:excisionase family DNA binding protein